MARATLRTAARLIHEGALALAEVEHAGVRVDVPYLDSQISEVDLEIRRRSKTLRGHKIYAAWIKRFGQKAKLGSKEQLATVIFDCLGHPRKAVAGKKVRSDEGDGEKKESKWNEEAFAHLDSEFVKEYFETEKLKKLLSTYLLGIKRECMHGYVHPSYNLHTVVSYRSSCNQPNWQNIVSRNPKIAAIIRRCYVPRIGRQFVESDFSGIEVRVACCYTKDPRLISEFTGPDGDPHGDTARELFFLQGMKFNSEEEKKWFKKGPRDWAKNRFVFPEFYGSVYFQCAPHLWQGVVAANMPDGTPMTKYMKSKGVRGLGDCSPDEKPRKGSFVHHVKEVEDSFWNDRFTVYTDWKKRWYEAYLKSGYIDMLTGFRVEGLFKRNEVLNLAIQGSAFHCELWSIIQIVKNIKKHKMGSLVVGEIHDCDVSDVVPGELQDYLSMVKEIKEVKLLKAMPWIIVPMATQAEVCEVDAPWVEKRDWAQNEKGIWAKS